MDHEVGAEGQRVAQVRRGEGVVDRDNHVSSVSDLDDGGDIGHRRGWVADRLQPYQTRLVPNGIRDELGISGVDRVHGDPGSLEHGVGQPDHAAIDGLRHDQLLSRAHRGQHRGVDGGHAGGGHLAGLRPFELGERLFKRLVGGIRIATVTVAGARELEQLGQLESAADFEGAALVDRNVDRRLGGRGHPARRADGAR